MCVGFKVTIQRINLLLKKKSSIEGVRQKGKRKFEKIGSHSPLFIQRQNYIILIITNTSSNDKAFEGKNEYIGWNFVAK